MRAWKLWQGIRCYNRSVTAVTCGGPLEASKSFNQLDKAQILITAAHMVTIPATYDYRLVALSVVIAIFAAYAALDLPGLVTATRNQARSLWLIGGAVPMGTRISSMHYTQILDFRFPPPADLHPP